MVIVLAIVVGVLFAGGTYMLLQRTLTRIVLGIALYGHAVNVVLLMSGGRWGEPPLIYGGAPSENTVDPMPQAMALTAIVITFGITAFLLALAYRSSTLTGDDIAEDDVEDQRIATQRLADEEAARGDDDVDVADYADVIDDPDDIRATDVPAGDAPTGGGSGTGGSAGRGSGTRSGGGSGGEVSS